MASGDTNCHYLHPEVYDDPVQATQTAVPMAELDREFDESRGLAIDAPAKLAEATRIRCEAIGVLHQLRGFLAHPEVLAPAFVRV